MKRSRIPVAIVFALALVLAFASDARADIVIAGHDLWTTPPGGAVEDFGGGNTVDTGDDTPAIPAGFFDGGSTAFTGEVRFGGVPLGTFGSQPTGPADTIVERLVDAVLPTVPSTDTIAIELVALSLTSTAPINVGNSGLWDVDVSLSSFNPSPGTMTIQHTSSGGGIYSASIGVCPVLTFTRVAPPNDTRTLEICDAPGQPQQISVTDNDWVHDAVLPLESPLSGPNFFVVGLTEHTGPHPVAEPVETPQPPAVPSAGMWALIVLSLALMTALGLGLGRRRTA